MSNDKLAKSAGLSHAVAFEEIEHTADCALKIFGADLPELLLNAAAGMNSLLNPNNDVSHRLEEISVRLKAIDAESLLVEWLNELAYWAETEMLVFHKFDLLSVSPTHIEAIAHGSRATQLEKHIKAVTYHNLEIIQTDGGVTATVVFDV
jgi:SHS2 domain-containing protein